MDALNSVVGSAGASMTTLTVLSTETKARVALLGPFQLAKVGRIINNMKGSSAAEFTNGEIDVVVKAIYVTQADDDIKAAFDMFDLKFNGSAKQVITHDEFKMVLPLLGEDMDAQTTEDLFAQVDEDKSGNIEFSEFKTLLLAVNPSDGKSAIPGFDFVKGTGGAAATSLLGGLSQTFTTFKVLEPETKMRVSLLGPLQVTKVGRIIKRMQEGSFSDAEIDIVVKAIYATQSKEDIKAAFDMFDTKLNNGTALGYITHDEFKDLLPLCGEDLSADDLEKLFTQVDEDKSGNIELNEFEVLLLGVNPPNDASVIPGFDFVKGQAAQLPGMSHAQAASGAAIGAAGAAVGQVRENAMMLPGANHAVTGVGHVTKGVGKLTTTAASGVGSMFNGVLAAGSAVAGTAAANYSAMSTLKPSTQSALVGANPLQMNKIGRIVSRLKAAPQKFSADDIDAIIRALYVTKDDSSYQKAFDIFDVKLSDASITAPQGHLYADEFKNVLPLLGEDVDQSKISELFEKVDADGSGSIELVEFKELCEAIVSEKKSGGLGGFLGSIEMPSMKVPNLPNLK